MLKRGIIRNIKVLIPLKSGHIVIHTNGYNVLHTWVLIPLKSGHIVIEKTQYGGNKKSGF